MRYGWWLFNKWIGHILYRKGGYHTYEGQIESTTSWKNVLGNIKEPWAREMIAKIIKGNSLDANGIKAAWVSLNMGQGNNADQGGWTGV